MDKKTAPNLYRTCCFTAASFGVPFRSDGSYSRLGRRHTNTAAQASTSTTNQLAELAAAGGYNTLERTKTDPTSMSPNQYEEIDTFARRNSYMLIPAEMDSMCVNPMYVQTKFKRESKTESQTEKV